MIAIIGGETHRFRPFIDLYKVAGKKGRACARKVESGLAFPGFQSENK